MVEGGVQDGSGNTREHTSKQGSNEGDSVRELPSGDATVDKDLAAANRRVRPEDEQNW